MPRLLVLLAVLAGLSLAPAAAQERVAFDRRAHLEGYEEVIFSSFADLYDLAPFEAAEGKLVDAAGLAELRSAWAAERARVEALLATERSDERRWSLFLLERELADHAFFSHVDRTRLDDVDGLVVYVQRPRKDEPGHAERVAREAAARLAPLREHLRTAYAEPAGLARRDGFGAEVVIVLATAGDASAYARLAGAAPHYRAWSWYDPKLRAAILLEDPLQREVTAADKARAARHAYAHLWLHAHDAAAETPLQEDWLREGLASFLAQHEAGPDGRLAVPADPPRETLRLLVEAMRSPATARTHVRRVDELYATPTYQHVASRAQVEAKREGRDPGALDFEGLQMCYWREALCLVDFLHRGDRRAGFLRLLADELAGRGGAPAFHRAFPADEPDAMDRAFLEHLVREHRRLVPDVPVSDAVVEAVLRGSAGGAAAVDSDGAGAAAAAAPPPFEPADLRPRDLDPPALLALSLDLARRGRSGDAEARLADGLAGSLEEDDRARLERAHAQIAAWNRLRAAWFGSLAAGGESYRFEHAGRSVRAKVEGVEDGRVRLAENRGDVRELVLDEIEPLGLAKAMGRDADALPDGWARALPYALAGERLAAQLLDASDPDEAALAADLAGDLPALLARGVPLGELDELSRKPVPDDPEACEEALARLAAVAGGHGEAPGVAARRADVRAYGRAALAVVFERTGPAGLVHGAWEDLPDGRVRISYGFDDEAELLDFARDDEYLALRRKALGDLLGETTEVRVADGALQAVGSATLRHRLGFAGPLSVRYDLAFRANPAIEDVERWFLLVGVRDDGRGSYAGALGRLDLEVVDQGRPTVAYAAERTPMFLDATYAMELVCDGEGRVRLSQDGAPEQDLPAGDLAGTGLFLLVHSDFRVRIKTLVIEAALDPAALAAARDAWIEDQITTRGL